MFLATELNQGPLDESEISTVIFLHYVIILFDWRRSLLPRSFVIGYLVNGDMVQGVSLGKNFPIDSRLAFREPPSGIEPETFALRERRSTD